MSKRQRQPKMTQSRLDEIDASVLADMNEDGAPNSWDNDQADTDEQPSSIEQRIRDVSMVMRAPKYDYEQIADYVPMPYLLQGWDKIDEEDRKIEGIEPYWDVCQLCELDQTDGEKEGWPALENLRSCGDRHYHNMTPIALAKMMLKMYDKTVRPGVEGDIPMRTRMFWLHIDVHAPTIKHMTEDSLRTMNNATRVIRDEEMFEEHTVTKRLKVAKGPATMFLKIEKEKKPYMKAVMEMRAARTS